LEAVPIWAGVKEDRRLIDRQPAAVGLRDFQFAFSKDMQMPSPLRFMVAGVAAKDAWIEHLDWQRKAVKDSGQIIHCETNW
jgi:hypothetical protein